jgi:formate/nitrite transporter FocA (FNT family)
MKSKDKDQDKHQEELEKTSEKIDSVDEHRDILNRVIREGEEIFKINNRAITLSAIIAGLEIGFSYFLICSLYYLLSGTMAENTINFFSLVYPIGFVLVVLGKSALLRSKHPFNHSRTQWTTHDLGVTASLGIVILAT